MRRFAFLTVLILSACSMPAVNAPSLAHRPAEDIDPRLPVPEPVLSTMPDPTLQRQLNALIAQAQSGDDAFRSAVPAAEKAVAGAGAAQSESWIAAQQALSALVGLREPVTRAAADVDALGAQRIQKLGGLAAADLKAIQAASNRVRAIDEAEAAQIGQLQERLAR
jgi:hypothetical protein